MEAAIVVDVNNGALTPQPVAFGRIPVSGDYIALSGKIFKVISVLFNVDAPNAPAYVKVVPPPT